MPRRTIESVVGLIAGYIVVTMCLILHAVGFKIWWTIMGRLWDFYPALTILFHLPFHFLFINSVWSYIQTVITRPGSPTSHQSIDGLRQCSKCNAPKDIRTHHCSVCNKCIYEMDHHCVWLAQCVGQRNRKFFVLFLINEAFLNCFTSLSLLYIFFFKDEFVFHFGSGYLSSGVLLMLTSVIGLTLIPFSLYHFWLVCNGLTTLEHITVGKNHKKWSRPWNYGSSKNLLFMFGRFPRSIFPLPSNVDGKEMAIEVLV
ncbi:hypothetical protein RCL1_008441 [Eukaryota sp. TZLM3-RCL]